MTIVIMENRNLGGKHCVKGWRAYYKQFHHLSVSMVSNGFFRLLKILYTAAGDFQDETQSLQDFYAWLISFCSLSSSSILNCDSFSGYLYKNHDASVQNRRK